MHARFYAKYDMKYMSVCDHIEKEALRGNRNPETKLMRPFLSAVLNVDIASEPNTQVELIQV